MIGSGDTTAASTDSSTATTLDPPSNDGDACIVWHRRHLRIRDQPAVTHATHEYATVCPLFVFDPHFYEGDALVCDARREFLHESLADLADQYDDADTSLVLAHGDPVEVLSAFADQGWDVVAAAEPTSRHGRRRDDRAKERAGVQFVADDGLTRDRENPRDGWADRVESYFESSPTTPDSSGFGSHTVDSAVSIVDIEDAYGVDGEKESVPIGGRDPALARLDRFIDCIHEYPGSISAPADAETGTSRLSPYLRFGCLSVREVFRRVKADAPDGVGKEMFRDRLYWNRHYTQKFLDWPG